MIELATYWKCRPSDFVDGLSDVGRFNLDFRAMQLGLRLSPGRTPAQVPVGVARGRGRRGR